MQLQSREELLFFLLKVTGSSELSSSEKIQQLLDGCRAFFKADYAIVSRSDGRSYVVRFLSTDDPKGVEGETLPLKETICQFVLRDRKPRSFQSVCREIADTPPDHNGYGFESYIGAPILVDSHPVGTLCFETFAARAEPFEQADLDLVALLAEWIGTQFQIDQVYQIHGEAITDSPSFFLQYRLTALSPRSIGLWHRCWGGPCRMLRV